MFPDHLINHKYSILVGYTNLYPYGLTGGTMLWIYLYISKLDNWLIDVYCGCFYSVV